MRGLLLGLALAVTLATGGVATAYDPCTAGYPDPAISLRQSAYDVKPGETIWLGGRLARNGCGLGRLRVGLFVRDRAGAALHWSSTVTTASSGEYTFALRPRGSFDAMVVFSGTPALRRAVTQVHHVTVDAVNDFDQPNYGYCDNEVQLPRRWQPPSGWQLELVGVPARLQTGRSVKAAYRVTNRTDREMKFATSYNGGARFVLLQDVRTGERPNGIGFTDMILGREYVVAPGQSVDVPASLYASHCYYRTIHPSRLRTIGWLDVRLRDEEQNIEQTVAWYAPPIAVEVVR